MAFDPCDYCHQETATITQTDKTTGDSVYIGPDCLPLLGLTLIASMPPELLDPALDTLGYQPKKSLRDQRKEADALKAEQVAAAALSEPPPTETAPTDGYDACPVCGALVADEDGLTHLQTEHPEIVTGDDLSAAIRLREAVTEASAAQPPLAAVPESVPVFSGGDSDNDPPPY